MQRIAGCRSQSGAGAVRSYCRLDGGWFPVDAARPFCEKLPCLGAKSAWICFIAPTAEGEIQPGRANGCHDGLERMDFSGNALMFFGSG